MSSEADKLVFENAMEPDNNVNLFEAKKWTYVTDSSNGQFNGQIQFDLNAVKNQNQFTNLSECVVNFPIKLLLKNGASATTGSTITVNSATLKNVYNFVDSVQIVLGGQTIQSSQIYENINTSYKLLTEMTEAEYKKLAPTLGLGFDDVEPLSDTAMAVSDSLDNSGLVLNYADGGSAKGFDLSGELHNSGIKQRLNMFNNSTVSTTLGRSILDGNQHVLGKSNVQINNVTTADAETFVLYALGTIRLKDVSDVIAKLPPILNLSGYIYINYNSTETVLTGGLTNRLSFMTSTAKYGRCCPASIVNHASAGLNFGTAVQPMTFTADISAEKSTSLTTAQPIQKNAILYAPYYQATPEITRALSMKKKIKYNERYVTEFNIDASGSVNQTLSSGLTNVKRVILYPYFTGKDTANQNTGFLTNPLLSPFDGCPTTTSPFCALKNLQLYIGNKPCFQSPVNMDWETFNNEVAQEPEKGLLNMKSWNQLYRYYTADIGRRLNSEDGSSKSVQISATNATLCPMKVIAMVWYEKEIVIDTATCEITRSM